MSTQKIEVKDKLLIGYFINQTLKSSIVLKNNDLLLFYELFQYF